MATPTTTRTYELDGTLLDACSCAGPCPCWVGDDPDGGKCETFVAYHIDHGQVRGVDVSSLTVVQVSQIPGNILAGNWRVVFYIDDRATQAQRQALVDVFGGKLGGAPADLAKLYREVVAVHFVPIEDTVENGRGILRVGKAVYSETSPYTDTQGRPTRLLDTIWTTISDSQAFVGKASVHRVNIPEHGMVWEFTGRNATQDSFRFEV
jgi:hypothetical protein